MKYLIIFVLIAMLSIFLASYGCSNNKELQKQSEDKRMNELKTFYYDNCQYIGTMTGDHNDILTHKGDCSNPIHKK